ncbi:MAG: hypothetical protein U9R19_07240 [Bacteroidota bacterium]|nr:hypothetical protein [Bacteroidota bacterium]
MKVKSNAKPFVPEFDKYFFQRQKWRENLAKVCKQITTFVEMETEKNISQGSLRRLAVGKIKVPEPYAGKLA